MTLQRQSNRKPRTRRIAKQQIHMAHIGPRMPPLDFVPSAPRELVCPMSFMAVPLEFYARRLCFRYVRALRAMPDTLSVPFLSARTFMM